MDFLKVSHCFYLLGSPCYLITSYLPACQRCVVIFVALRHSRFSNSIIYEFTITHRWLAEFIKVVKMILLNEMGDRVAL